MNARWRAGPLISVAGGLVLAGTVVAPWVRHPVVREVGGVPIVEQVTAPGTQFAGTALLVAVAVVALGLLALLLPSARRVLGVALWLVSFVAPGIVGWGVWLARDTGGALTPAPFVAFLSGFAAFLGAAVMRSGPRGREPMLDERYTVEGAPAEDEEWRMAADEPADESDGSGPPVG